ncbi:hypothetical protein TRIUR3_27533 [Triticum urartu]|uniref:C2H2-type domain-containing protein n=1 Tax=Triticum urartu TaxID=4572 RepID=M7ZXA2_TRIUA|nr:hypothetical protein TRIUR3_27533 [Triticum urartu]
MAARRKKPPVDPESVPASQWSGIPDAFTEDATSLLDEIEWKAKVETIIEECKGGTKKMKNSDHFASNNHLYLQHNHQRSPGTGVVEACDLERIRHEQSRHGQEAEEHRSDPSAALTTYLTFLEHKVGQLRGILCSAPRHPQQQRAIVSAELRCIIVQLSSIANDLASDSGAGAADVAPRFFYSCLYAGCKRNREHRDFQPLKTPVCVKNHYRRSHCDKSHVCRRCGVKRFSVLADLRTHEKHCGRDRWVCSCGVSFSRKDKLFAHVAIFDGGHTPALPPSDDEATGHCTAATATATAINSVLVPGSGGLLPTGGEEAVNLMEQSFSGQMLDGLNCSGAKVGIDDVRAKLSSPVGIDFCDFDGFDLLGAVAMDFNF